MFLVGKSQAKVLFFFVIVKENKLAPCVVKRIIKTLNFHLPFYEELFYLNNHF